MAESVIIENPIINSPFAEPVRHFKFDDLGITNQIDTLRRPSSYFMPIARPRKRGKQEIYEEWTADRVEENKTVNRIRQRVKAWRDGRYAQDVTRTTARLLEHWQRRDRNRRLFFCQIEALETLIYITEVAGKYGDSWIESDLREFAEHANPGLLRLACKLATGAGKTAVMAMAIAWQTLNKLANPRDARFADAFLVCTPGITIRDRLRVLLPSDPENYYKTMEIVPPDAFDQMHRARISIVNFHAFMRREKMAAGALTKRILSAGGESPFLETEGEMALRVTRGLGQKKNIIIFNDEAHHCYRRRVDAAAPEETLAGEDRKEAQQRDEEARIWLTGLQAVQKKLGVKQVFDLSATPFYLRGSGWPEGTLFQWVVSDFSLVDAIESGIVKVPRVPVADDSGVGEQPAYRNLWLRIRDSLPKKGRSAQAVIGEPKLPLELESALQSLYGHYRKYYERWQAQSQAAGQGLTPPVFIVVCNNTNVSKLVFDYIAGWEKPLADGAAAAVPGKLDLFSNVSDGRFVDRPNTILVDSAQLESGDVMSADFRAIAAREIDEFKAEYRQRFPERDAAELTDEQLLREVLNTVGKPGKLGEHIRCVVSVSMLTEGWDANTVTHILGVRAFGTQLLCEQVIGRGLRRTSYEPRATTVQVNGASVALEAFAVEYAEVYGVPFSFIPCSGGPVDRTIGPMPTRVRAVPSRIGCEITFPRIEGYRYELPDDRLTAHFSAASHLVLSAENQPTSTENAPLVGETAVHTLDDLKKKRPQTVAFEIARAVLQKLSAADDAGRPWLFPDLLTITQQWMRQCVEIKDHAFPQLLLLARHRADAADRIYNAIVQASGGEKRLLAIAQPYDAIGSTRYVDFDTTRPTFRTNPEKCHISHVAADTQSWEQKLAQTLEEMPEVICYVKNQNLGFTIPYVLDGQPRRYVPDFIVRINDGHGRENPLSLILEVTGQEDREKEAKVATAQTQWIPAVNNSQIWGRWQFLEITDPWTAEKTVRRALKCCMEAIQTTPGICGGSPRVRNTRIPVWTVVQYRRLGATTDEILADFPSLQKADIHRVEQYYRHHQQEIDEEIARQERDD